jgi:hypothetical protein
MNIVLLKLTRVSNGPWLVRGLAGAPELPGTLFDNRWPSVESI